ncbi:unnamed protein product [Eruca vesicaria subsp. sativa]|uniref:Uncharacterized protein n=1 Tax=Eruca vesicaria subsp. sativa TaxID=29727 RepID=A0ABC8JI35_ERUVS|nr:unnamed protein product [Eruca vesicaria subsp. sativa]
MLGMLLLLSTSLNCIKRLQSNQNLNLKDDLSFEFKALELVLEISCLSLDAQVNELEMERYPVLDELASNISTLNLEHVRRLKRSPPCLNTESSEEHLMDDDDDMAEMYLTEKKERSEAHASVELEDNLHEDFESSGISRDESVTKAAVEGKGDLADVVGEKTKPLFSNFTFCGEFLSECLDSEDEDLKDTARWAQGMIARPLVTS